MSSGKLEDIDENRPADWAAAAAVRPPETPTESMEFLARSWSLSAAELSKALTTTSDMESKLLEKADDVLSNMHLKDTQSFADKIASLLNIFRLKTNCGFGGVEVHNNFLCIDSRHRKQFKSRPSAESPPISPSGSDETKELFLLHQALQPDFLYTQHLLKNGIYKNVVRGKSMGWWSKEQKERKKHELRTHNAQLHAAVSVAGVAAAVAALTAAAATFATDTANPGRAQQQRMSGAIASAAALVASHCIEIAEEMGADHHQILSAVDSAVNARSNGDVMALTAGAATALRGASTLKARLQDGCGAAGLVVADEEGRETNTATALNFVSRGGELLKRTRKGDLHWKQVSFRMNSASQVVVKLKSKHVGGTFTKKKKFAVSRVYTDVRAWPGREKEDYDRHRAYFGIQIAERIIEFECINKAEKQIWADGIQQMLNCRVANVA